LFLSKANILALSFQTSSSQPLTDANATNLDVETIRENRRRRLNADLQKKREKVARLEQELLAAKEDYVKAEKAEQEFLLSVGLSSKQSKPHDESTIDQINVIIDNKATCIPRNDIIYLSDIEASVCSQRESFANNYRRSNYGVRECLHPPGLTCVPTKDWGRYKLSHEYIERLFKLFKGEKCTFSKTAQYLFGCGYHCNSGGSDEAAINIQAATLRGLFHDIGIPQTKITNLMIAKSLPSRTQIVILSWSLVPVASWLFVGRLTKTEHYTSVGSLIMGTGRDRSTSSNLSLGEAMMTKAMQSLNAFAWMPVDVVTLQKRQPGQSKRSMISSNYCWKRL
jgi:hypothetical protein